MTTEINITEHDIASAMLVYGGGFAESLARTYFKADDENRRRIEAAFPELWSQFRGIATINKKSKAAEAE